MRRAPPRPILLTGLSGFAGHHLAGALARGSGTTLVGTVHEHPAAVAGVETVALDLTDAAAVDALIGELRPAAVVHTAALTDPNACEREPRAATAANADATGHLVRALDAHAPNSQLVHFSTDLVYPGDRALSREVDPVGPLMHYGRTKLAAEELVRARRGPWTVLRCALLYGPPSPRKGGATGWIAAALREGRTVTLFEDEHRTPVHVADVIDAVAACLERPAGSGVVNLGGGERLTRFDMGVAIAEATGQPTSSLRAARLAESTFEAPRPADVSMDTTRLAALLGRAPLGFREGVHHL